MTWDAHRRYPRGMPDSWKQCVVSEHLEKLASPFKGIHRSFGLETDKLLPFVLRFSSSSWWYPMIFPLNKTVKNSVISPWNPLIFPVARLGHDRNEGSRHVTPPTAPRGPPVTALCPAGLCRSHAAVFTAAAPSEAKTKRKTSGNQGGTRGN